ncbi:MAG: phosphate acyltransferase [Longimicrobiales bacterium]|nr:phosphate acyltransferase [Longimicrobiales bacterium]
MPAIATFEELLGRTREADAVPVAVVAAENESALRAVAAASAAGFARPVLIGAPDTVRAVIDEAGLRDLRDARLVPARSPEAAAETAVELARSGEAAVLLKGSLRTDQLLKAVLHRDRGLRTGRFLSDVLLYQDTLAGRARLVGVTDGGINPEPDQEALKQIVANAVDTMRALGWDRPRVALLSATEAVTDAVASTGRARAVAEWAARHLEGADVAGPLALDNALLESAARAKGIEGPVAGRADVLVTPSIEAGNILGKGVKYLGGSITAHVVVGARVPILIPSRVESAEDKLHSIALGVLVAASGRPGGRPGTERAADRGPRR